MKKNMENNNHSNKQETKRNTPSVFPSFPSSVLPKEIIIGNSFSFTLIKRPVSIRPASLPVLSAAAKDAVVYSFWGHDNTRAAAEAFCGLPLTPSETRPVIHLDDNGYPFYAGHSFHEVWLLSPVYRNHFRPAVGEEVRLEDIESWNVLKLSWEED